MLGNSASGFALLALGAWLLSSSPTSATETRGQIVQSMRADLAAAAEALDELRHDEAATLYGRVLDRARALGGPKLLLARAADGLADVHRQQGRPAVAEPLYRLALANWEVLLGPEQPRLATTLHNLATVCLAQGNRDEAASMFCRALAIWEATLGPGSAEAQQSRQACLALRDR